MRPADVAAYIPAHSRITMLLVVVLPFLGLLAGSLLFWGHGFSETQLGISLGMYPFTALGVTLGHHRLFAHRSFEAVWPVRLALGILGMGEGWHNNHHAFASSARHGLKWWQMDLTYLIIHGLGALRLASRVRLPSKNAVAEKRYGHGRVSGGSLDVGVGSTMRQVLPLTSEVDRTR